MHFWVSLVCSRFGDAWEIWSFVTVGVAIGTVSACRGQTQEGSCELFCRFHMFAPCALSSSELASTEFDYEVIWVGRPSGCRSCLVCPSSGGSPCPRRGPVSKSRRREKEKTRMAQEAENVQADSTDSFQVTAVVE